MNAHSTMQSFDMTTLEGQRAAARARALRFAPQRLNLVVLPPRKVDQPQEDARPDPTAEAQRGPVAIVPEPTMACPGETAPIVRDPNDISHLPAREQDVILQIRAMRGACARIAHEICIAYNVSHEELWSPRRISWICHGRQEAYFRMRCETLRSLPEIGRRCGGRDHTTVLHGIRKITRLLETGWRMKTRPDVIGYGPGGYKIDPAFLPPEPIEVPAEVIEIPAELAAAEQASA